MTNNHILLAFITLYLIITVFIGWWASRFVKNTSDFVMAGRRMPMTVVRYHEHGKWCHS